MILVDLAFAFGIALLLSVLLIPLLGPGRIGWSEFLLCFILLLLFTWAGGIWFRPLGPTLWDVPFLVMLGLGGVLAMFLALLLEPPVRGARHAYHVETPPRRRRQRVEDLPAEAVALRASSPEDAVADVTFVSFGLLFWVLVALLLGLILGNYAVVGQ